MDEESALGFACAVSVPKGRHKFSPTRKCWVKVPPPHQSPQSGRHKMDFPLYLCPSYCRLFLLDTCLYIMYIYMYKPMSHNIYKAALDTAYRELVELLKQQEKIQKEILNRRRTITSLLNTLDEGRTANLKAKISLSYANYMHTQSLTEDVRSIIRNTGEEGIHRVLIREELSKLGRGIENHSNPSGTVNSILVRLKEKGEVEEVPDSKTGVKILRWK